MASTRRLELEILLVEKPRWKHGNIGFIDHAEPLIIRNGRQHSLIHWDNPCYKDEYVDWLYMHKMEDISKSKRTWYSPGEEQVSPEQRVTLKGLQKSRALGRRLFEESSSHETYRHQSHSWKEGRKKSPALQEKSKQSSWRRQLIMEEDDKMFPCNIDPFSEELVY